VVRTRTFYFQKFRVSLSYEDFYIYQKLCSDIAKAFNKAKKNSWKKLCSNLDPSTSLTELWCTEKKFKICLNHTSLATNDEWFESFCSKISPPYLPSEFEISSEKLPNITNPQNHRYGHFATLFSKQELSLAISSRESPTGGLDNISPLLFQHLPDKTFDTLFTVFNNLWVNNVIHGDTLK